MADYDNVQHGIDDNPSGDAEKGAKLGGVGGAVTGLVAGAAAGPAGALIGAVIGGVAGAVASGAAVAAVDRVDNDNTITGIGGDDHEHYRNHYNSSQYSSSGRSYDEYAPSYAYGQSAGSSGRYANDYTAHENDIRSDYSTRYPDRNYDNDRDAIHTGYNRGRSMMSGAGATESGAALGGATSEVKQGTNAEAALGGNAIPGIQTGGMSYDGTTPDTRGITEKIADKLTGDHTDDKTGKAV